MEEKKKQRRHRVLRNSADPKSMFSNTNFTPEEILRRLGRPRSVLSSSSKVEKSRSRGYLTRVCYLTSAVYCSHSSGGCRSTCLGFTSGRMGSDQATLARDRRTALYAADTQAFLNLLRHDLHQLCYDAETAGLKPACRLNGSSDIPYELLHGEIFAEFPTVAFYDYSKVTARVVRYLESRRSSKRDGWPSNYHLTFSASEDNAKDVPLILSQGGNVAIVFWPDLPTSMRIDGSDYPVINGDQHDLRFRDSGGVVIGLQAKGVAKSDLTGFVVQTDKPTALRVLNNQNAA